MNHRLKLATNRRCALFALAITTAVATPFCGAQSSVSLRDITVDAGKTMGQLKPLRGVSGPPDTTYLPKEMERPPFVVRHNISSGYQSALVNVVRTHDSNGSADIDPTTGPLEPLKGEFGPPVTQARGPNLEDQSAIFPNPAADPNDPKSYNWGPTDKLLGPIHDIGADVLFRLGREGQTTAPPPTDLVKYASIVRHIVLHYNKGWDNGFENRVRYWEVWNEPDLGQIWWRGTPEQYYAMYAAFAGAVKEADPNSLVGGPTIAMINEATPYREGFLAYARDHKLPLDFYSWHWYSDGSDPYDFIRLGFQMRQMLDSYGFTKTLSFLDKWNDGMGSMMGKRDETQSAAFMASSLIYMQDAPIDQEAFYRADSLFGADGSKPNKSGQTLIAAGRMAATPVRLVSTGADTTGLAVEAGRSEDGDTFQVLISNYEIPEKLRQPRSGPDVMSVPGLFNMQLLPLRTVNYANNGGYNLTVSGLAGGDYVVERYRIDASHDFSLIDSQKLSGDKLTLSAELPAPSVELIVIRKAAQ